MYNWYFIHIYSTEEIRQTDKLHLSPLGFSSNSSYLHLPYLITNALLSTAQQQEKWAELMEVHAERWLAFGEINIVAGPVYDWDADSLHDDFFTTG